MEVDGIIRLIDWLVGGLIYYICMRMEEMEMRIYAAYQACKIQNAVNFLVEAEA